MLSFLYVYSHHSILECYNLFSGVELSMRSFCVIFEYLKSHKGPGFTEDLNIIQSQRQAPNLNKLLTKAEFTSKKPCVSKCGDSRCECCHHLCLSDHYSFKNVNKILTLKTSFSCDSSNLIYVVICSGCQEQYIGETCFGKSKLRDRVRIYRQHIRQQEYQQLKMEEHLHSCGRDKFTIFPLLQMCSDDNYL